MDNEDSTYVDTFFARQPIFTGAKAVWGYELLYRGSAEDTTASFDDNDIATLTVISNAITNISMESEQASETDKKILIHFSRESILREIPLALPASTTLVQIDESFALDRELVAALVKLRKEGYQLGLNNYQGRKGAEVLLKVSNIVFIDILGKERAQVEALAQKAAQFPPMLAAKRVEDLEHFQMAKELGFSLFEGFFFQKPEIIPGRKLSSNQISRLMLFDVLSNEDPEYDELAKVIQADVSISYRLLSFINSAAFSLPRKVESIRQALLLLGWKQVKSWLWLVVLTDMTPDDKTSELPYISSIRAKFLEGCAANHSSSAAKAPTLYLLGLFSLLEPMLDMPMKGIADNLPIDDKVKAALCGENNEYSIWLELALNFERGDWDALDNIIDQLGFDPMAVANAYSEALVWAKSFHEQSLGGEGE